MLVWAYLLKRNEKKKKESSEYIYIYSKGVKICNLKKNIIFFLNWNKQKVKVILILTKKKSILLVEIYHRKRLWFSIFHMKSYFLSLFMGYLPFSSILMP